MYFDISLPPTPLIAAAPVSDYLPALLKTPNWPIRGIGKVSQRFSPEEGRPHIYVEAVLEPKETYHNQAGRLHREDGPAIVYWNDEVRWLLDGIEVTEKIVLHPEKITKDDVILESNAEVRRIMLTRGNREKLLKGSRLVHRGKRAELISMHGMTFIRVQNSTPEPDGTSRSYYLRVPSRFTDADEAVAWTFFMEKNEYRPTKET